MTKRLISTVLTVVLAGSVLLCATVAAADTAVETTNPFTFAGTNPCTGESFVGSGGVHFLVGGNLSTSGMTQSHFEANLQGMKATTIMGKKYVVVDTSNQTLVFDTTDLMPFHEKLEWTVQFIRQGEDGALMAGDDFYEHILAHSTVNANGVVTVDDFTDDQRCQ